MEWNQNPKLFYYEIGQPISLPQMVMSIVAVESVLKAEPQYLECRTFVFEQEDDPANDEKMSPSLQA